ncbi:TMEM175 family protein [Flavobacterium flavipallidum]|uniref:TMEM175 family protein n=1 Tax=Flavobacterium flavipallidum TaxID=3139140 RepID=A0ABU9HJ88_9FLAO
MNKTRLEAFSDGVLAIIITIMVLELKVPEGENFNDLLSLLPVFVSYILSFIYVGIYWNNHHHLLHSATRVNGKILWANLHLLFWLSLIPASTAWMGEHDFAKATVTVYGVVLFMSAIAFTILQTTIICIDGGKSFLAEAIGKDVKGKISQVLYLTAIIVSFFNQWISLAIYLIVALMWLVPDSRIEKKILESK